MYLKMLLADQLIEERLVHSSQLYTGDHLQTLIEKMIRQHECEIENCGEQPQFILSQYPSKKPKESFVAPVFSKLAFFLKIFG